MTDAIANFAALCPEAPLPWRGEFNEIFDADGRRVCLIRGEYNEAVKIVTMIIVAVNTCGGYRAELSETQCEDGPHEK